MAEVEVEETESCGELGWKAKGVANPPMTLPENKCLIAQASTPLPKK
jgi:hypothetical protein